MVAVFGVDGELADDLAGGGVEGLLDLQLQVRPVGEFRLPAVDVGAGDVPDCEVANCRLVGQYLDVAVLLARVCGDETLQGDLRRHDPDVDLVST